jgi:hypothetical protein
MNPTLRSWFRGLARRAQARKGPRKHRFRPSLEALEQRQLLSGSPPTVTALSPSTEVEGSAAFTLTVTGTNFDSTATVLFNGTQLTTTFLSATQVAAKVPTSLVADEGTATISVTEDNGTSDGLPFTVTDATLSNLTINNPNATEGIGFSGFTVATFTDANTSAPATDFTATVTWGDGSSSAASVVATGTTGTFAVVASHTYAEEGTETLSVAVLDHGGSSISNSATIAVADAALSHLTIHAPVGATEGEGTGTFTVASFSDANTSAPLTDFTAVITWGDGTTSSVTSANGLSGSGGNFVVKTSHTFAASGTLTLSVHILDAGGSSVSGQSSATVAASSLAVTTVHAVHGLTEGQGTGTFTVATFTDSKTSEPASNFTAVIQWGDGTTSTVTSANGISGSNGSFVVQSSHTYAEEITSATVVSVRILDSSGPSASSVSSTFTVADGTLSNLTIHNPGATEGVTVSTFTVATFTDAHTTAHATDFTATVTWGDGISTSGVVVGTGTPGLFAVLASHPYAEEGTKTLSVAVLDVGGASTSGSTTIHVADAALNNLVINNPKATAGANTGIFTVATFHDVNAGAPVSDFTATIRWGDGSTSTVSGASGGVVSLGGGNFAVLSSHTYASGGAFSLAVSVADVGGSAVSGTTGISVVAPATAPAGSVNDLIMQEVHLGVEMVVFFQATSLVFPSLIDSITTQLATGGMPIGEELLFIGAGSLAFPGLTRQVGGTVGTIAANSVYMTPTGFALGVATYDMTFAYVNGLVSAGLPSGGMSSGGMSSGG